MSSRRSDWRERLHANPSRMEQELAIKLQHNRMNHRGTNRKYANTASTDGLKVRPVLTMMVRMDLEMTRVSSKGQVVIPGLIRERLGLTGGSRLLVFGEGDTIILKKVGLASEETRETLAAVRKKIRELRVTREDVSREIRLVRKERARRPVETAAGS